MGSFRHHVVRTRGDERSGLCDSVAPPADPVLPEAEDGDCEHDRDRHGSIGRLKSRPMVA